MNEQAHNLKLGAIYALKGTYEKVRLITASPNKKVVWVENAQGEGKTISFKDLLYAHDKEVKIFLED